MTAKAFCSEHDIVYRSLIEWRHRERKKNTTEDDEREAPESTAAPKQFVEIDCPMPRALSSESASPQKNPPLLAELDLPAGITLRIYQSQRRS